MEFLRSYNSDINNVLSPLETPAIAGLLRLFLVLYGGLMAPALPDSILKWFGYVPFRIFVLFLIAYTGNRDPALSVLIAVAFYVSMNVLAGRRAFEKFQDRQYYY